MASRAPWAIRDGRNVELVEAHHVMTEYHWRHEEIAALISRVSIKTCDGFSEKDPSWICPGCGRSKPQIVAPGPNVDVVACIYRHHDHIEDLIARLLDRELPKPLSPDERVGRRRLKAELMRRFCRFKAVDVCHACNNVDTAAKKIVGAPSWFSFSPRGLRNVIRRPEPYASHHEIDLDRLRVVWDQVWSEIEGLEDRITQAIRRIGRATQPAGSSRRRSAHATATCTAGAPRKCVTDAPVAG